MAEFDKLCKMIGKCNNILIITHKALDGDALASSLAIYNIVTKMGKKAKLKIEADIPDFLSFLTDKRDFLLNEGEEYTYNFCIAVDCADIGRFDDRMDYFTRAEHTANIDHHKTNSYYADINIVNPEKASTCEIIFDILEYLGIEPDQETAKYIYVGMATDTGGFRYPNTKGDTHRTAAKLLDRGLPVGELSDRMFEFATKAHLLLLSMVLSRMEFHHDGKLAIATLSSEDMRSVNAKDADIEELVNYGRRISEVEVSVLLHEKNDGSIKGSLRSAKIDVSRVAEKVNGGGHANAAGCLLNIPLDNAKEVLIDLLENELCD